MAYYLIGFHDEARQCPHRRRFSCDTWVTINRVAVQSLPKGRGSTCRLGIRVIPRGVPFGLAVGIQCVAKPSKVQHSVEPLALQLGLASWLLQVCSDG